MFNSFLIISAYICHLLLIFTNLIYNSVWGKYAALIAQLVEHAQLNSLVGGLIPSLGRYWWQSLK